MINNESATAENGSILPAYMRIRQYVMGQIRKSKGRFEKIMSVRKLCKVYKVSHPTVLKALQQLVEEGSLICKPGLGTFINPEVALSDKQCISKSMTSIGIIISSGQLIHYDHFYLKMLSAIFNYFADESYMVRLINLASIGADAVSEIKGLNLDGIIWINPSSNYIQTLNLLDKENFPLILIDFFRVEATQYTIRLDLAEAGYEAMKYLHELGHEKIVFSGDSHQEFVTNRLLKGFKKAHADLKKTFDDRLIIMGDEDIPSKLKMMIDLKVEFTAIFAESATYEIICETLKKTGKHIPADISIITEENSITLKAMHNNKTEPTRLVKPLSEIGQIAAKTMVKLIRNKTKSPVNIKLDWKIKSGNTCRKI